MRMGRIFNQKNGNLNEHDRLELLKLLGKAGYIVALGKEKPGQKSNAQYIHYVEFYEDGKTYEKERG